MAKVVLMVMWCLLALALNSIPANAVDCRSVLASIFPCSNYLGNILQRSPGLQCCSGASAVAGKGDIDSLCKCFRLNPLSTGFIPSKAQQIPTLCNLSSFLPLVECLLPTGNSAPPLSRVVPGSPAAINMEQKH